MRATVSVRYASTLPSRGSGDWNATYSSPISSKLLFDARVSDIIQGWKDRYPAGGTRLEFTEPLPDVFKTLIAVTEQGGLIPGLLYRGAGQTGLGPFITVGGWIASAQASLSYVTGSHAFKVGFLDTFGTRLVNYTNIDSNTRYQFNNGVPNQITEVATPYGFRSNLGAELGIYAQDRWTIKRLTLQGAVRGLRLKTAGTQGNVVRRVHLRDVQNGIVGDPDQRDFYVCDNVLEGRLAGDVAALLADDDGQFAFVVDFVAAELPGQEDRVAGVLHGARVLHEHHRVRGDGLLPLLGVPAVVQADAEQVGRRDGREELARLEGRAGDLEVAEDVAGDGAGGTVGLECRMGRTGGGEVADELHRGGRGSPSRRHRAS